MMSEDRDCDEVISARFSEKELLKSFIQVQKA